MLSELLCTISSPLSLAMQCKSRNKFGKSIAGVVDKGDGRKAANILAKNRKNTFDQKAHRGGDSSSHDTVPSIVLQTLPKSFHRCFRKFGICSFNLLSNNGDTMFINGLFRGVTIQYTVHYTYVAFAETGTGTGTQIL